MLKGYLSNLLKIILFLLFWCDTKSFEEIEFFESRSITFNSFIAYHLIHSWNDIKIVTFHYIFIKFKILMI